MTKMTTISLQTVIGVTPPPRSSVHAPDLALVG